MGQWRMRWNSGRRHKVRAIGQFINFDDPTVGWLDPSALWFVGTRKHCGRTLRLICIVDEAEWRESKAAKEFNDSGNFGNSAIGWPNPPGLGFKVSRRCSSRSLELISVKDEVYNNGWIEGARVMSRMGSVWPTIKARL